MIDQEVRAQIRMLLSVGSTQRELAGRFDVSRRSVVRIARESTTDVGTSVGRPSKTQPYTGLIRRTLASSPEVRSATLLQLARAKGYSGSRTAMYQRIRVVRAELHGRSRIETIPAESLAASRQRRTATDGSTPI